MSRTFEILMGMVIVVLFALFAWMLTTNTNRSQSDAQQVVAIFTKVDGLGVGADVRIGGVPVGRVSQIEVDPNSFEVLATLDIDPEMKITQDTTASVLSEGLLGGGFVSLRPGFGSPLETGGFLENTNDALNISEMLGQLIFSVAGE